MKPALLLAVLAGLAAPLAHAGPPAPPAPPITYVLIDHSTSALIEPGAARDVLRERLPAELKRLYPVRKWGFVSEVEGGFDDAKLCIITARTMMLPRTTTGALVFKPEKTATTFGAKASATAAECKALAKAKLAESTEALRFGLIGR